MRSPPQADLDAGAPPVDRRRSDRRASPTTPFSRFTFVGRRIRGRRRGEKRNLYVDRFTHREWMLATGILLLSLLDLVLTLQYLDLGGEEANPIMALALESGRDTFAAWKIALTLCGAAFLLFHARFRGVRAALEVLFVLYLVLIGYHAALRIAIAG